MQTLSRTLLFVSHNGPRELFYATGRVVEGVTVNGGAESRHTSPEFFRSHRMANNWDDRLTLALGFRPNNFTPDGQSHRLKIQVVASGATQRVMIRSRRGCYASMNFAN